MRYVVHTADLHIGKNRTRHDHLEQQRMMLWAILLRLVDFAANHPDDEIWFVIAGDVFDRNEDTTREELYLFLEFLNDLSEQTRPFKNVHTYIIDGNHDRQPDQDCPSVLSPIVNFTPSNVTMAIVDPLFVEDKGLLLIPFGCHKDADYRRLIDTYKPQFVVGHECLSQIITDTGYTPRKIEKYLDIENVEQGVVAVFMGDIHNCQPVGKTAWYSGSPVTLDHGHRPPKGILIHGFENEGGKWVRAFDPELESLDEPKIKTHHQIGKVVDEAKVADIIEDLKDHENKYIQIIVTPETYAAIEKEIPGFFHNPQVNWEFKQEAVGIPAEDATPSDDPSDYYRPLISQWVATEVQLVDEEKEECKKRLNEIFDKRV